MMPYFKDFFRSSVAVMLSLSIFSFILPVPIGASAKKEALYFKSLQERLIKDGFEKDRIALLYNRPEVDFETKGTSLFLIHREARLNYDQFTTRESIKKASAYMEKHSAALDSAEKEYGVSKEVITAIILVETRLGKYLGGPSVLNTLSTMASLSDPEIRDMFWGKISTSAKVTRQEYEKWAKKKSKWAYRELKAFLKYTDKEGKDPVSIYGSYAGAMGISQFMPSNIQTLGKDGNNDGHIDLFDHEDAIASVANYLKHYGWHPGISSKKAHKVLLRYNYSKYYANTILKISRQLKG
ncbi:MAG: lytic murein transglycosylase [Deltaproteobacteria bacterium]|nr:lytic murein transglycosylase [Deltaproteobacteria bacterium]